MNFSDSEIVASILSEEYTITDDPKLADVILVNTCSIRDHAEQRVFKRLSELNTLRKKNNCLQIGLIGCMAERIKDELFAKGNVDLVVGPDAYRDLPAILKKEFSTNINVLLSEVETYDDISPIRYDSNGISAFISIMRGCNNFCAYCVVPYTRGRERSRNGQTIINEAQRLFENGYKEITLLGQNVNSYLYQDMNFSQLIESVAKISPLLRIRFATSHPKDLSDELLKVMASYPNICRNIHLPAQSGSNAVLKAMNRKYTRQWYLDRIAAIRQYMPDCGISTDMIAGFCGETQADHEQSLSLMETVGYDYAYMFKYSMREGTVAHKSMEDNIDEVTKSARLEEIIALQQQLSHKNNLNDVGKTFEILVEGISKRSNDYLFGRNSQNKVVVFPKGNHQKGEYVQVKITSCTSATLKGVES